MIDADIMKQLIGSIIFIVSMLSLIFAAWIFCTETLPKIWWKWSTERKRLMGRSDFEFRYGRPEVKP